MRTMTLGTFCVQKKNDFFQQKTDLPENDTLTD